MTQMLDPLTLYMSPRLIAAATALALLALLSVAASLDPDSRGLGTHEQLEVMGLKKCPFLVSTGHPCATCGMTTSFAHAAEGNLWASFLAQPFGSLLAVASATGFWIALHVAITGSRAAEPLRALLRPRWLWSFAVLLIAAWVYKLVVTPAPGI